jgi:hypothetical protein
MYAAALNRPPPITGSRPGQRRGPGTQVRPETVADGLPGPLTWASQAEPPLPRQ